MRAHPAALLAFLILASGCLGFSHQESSMTYSGTTFRHADDDDFIRITAIGDDPPRWSEVTLTQTEVGEVRVRLNLAPSKSNGQELRQSEEWNAGGLGSGTVRVNDRLRFCSMEDRGGDGAILVAIVRESSMGRHSTDHLFEMPLPACA